MILGDLKSMVSPTLAVVVLGVNTKLPLLDDNSSSTYPGEGNPMM